MFATCMTYTSEIWKNFYIENSTSLGNLFFFLQVLRIVKSCACIIFFWVGSVIALIYECEWKCLLKVYSTFQWANICCVVNSRSKNLLWNDNNVSLIITTTTNNFEFNAAIWWSSNCFFSARWDMNWIYFFFTFHCIWTFIQSILT